MVLPNSIEALDIESSILEPAVAICPVYIQAGFAFKGKESLWFLFLSEIL